MMVVLMLIRSLEAFIIGRLFKSKSGQAGAEDWHGSHVVVRDGSLVIICQDRHTVGVQSCREGGHQARGGRCRSRSRSGGRGGCRGCLVSSAASSLVLRGVVGSIALDKAPTMAAMFDQVLAVEGDAVLGVVWHMHPWRH